MENIKKIMFATTIAIGALFFQQGLNASQEKNKTKITSPEDNNPLYKSFGKKGVEKKIEPITNTFTRKCIDLFEYNPDIHGHEKINKNTHAIITSHGYCGDYKGYANITKQVTKIYFKEDNNLAHINFRYPELVKNKVKLRYNLGGKKNTGPLLYAMNLCAKKNCKSMSMFGHSRGARSVMYAMHIIENPEKYKKYLYKLGIQKSTAKKIKNKVFGIFLANPLFNTKTTFKNISNSFFFNAKNNKKTLLGLNTNSTKKKKKKSSKKLWEKIQNTMGGGLKNLLSTSIDCSIAPSERLAPTVAELTLHSFTYYDKNEDQLIDQLKTLVKKNKNLPYKIVISIANNDELVGTHYNKQLKDLSNKNKQLTVYCHNGGHTYISQGLNKMYELLVNQEKDKPQKEVESNFNKDEKEDENYDDIYKNGIYESDSDSDFE